MCVKGQTLNVMPTVVVLSIALILSTLAGLAIARDLPEITKEDLPHQDRVAAFVSTFLERDAQARELLNPSNRAFFGEGHRPKIGVPHDPEASGKPIADIKAYFVRKLYLDLNSIRPLDQPTFQAFVDQVNAWSGETLNCAGEIIMKYDLNVEGKFSFEAELAKVPIGPERENLKRCWLNDSILGTELRMLAWMHEKLFKAPYVLPWKR